MTTPAANHGFLEPEASALIAAILRGDPGRFEELIRAQEPMIKKILRRYLKCEDDVHDALQTTWLKVWLNLGGFRGESKFRSWLVRIAINEALQVCRNRSRLRMLSMDSAVPASDLLTRASTRTHPVVPFLTAAIEGLPSPYNRALAAHALEGLTDAELATAEAISLAAAKSRLHRARSLMRLSWQK